MLLLGVLAAQAEGAVAVASDYDLLETEILTGTQTLVEFTGLNTAYAADYQHLQFRMTFGQNTGLGIGAAEIQFNSNNGTRSHRLWGNGSSVQSGEYTTTTSFFVNGNATSDIYTGMVLDVLDPFNSSKNTTVRWLSGSASTSEPFVQLGSGFWNNTATITSIGFNRTASWVAGSRFSLYGLKGA